jgi:hypothetical protein
MKDLTSDDVPHDLLIKDFLSVNKRRAEERREWLALAVETCKRWHAKPQKTDRVAWITEKVNDGLEAHSSGKRIKRNTITRNLPEIEKLAKGNDHVKG